MVCILLVHLEPFVNTHTWRVAAVGILDQTVTCGTVCPAQVLTVPH